MVTMSAGLKFKLEAINIKCTFCCSKALEMTIGYCDLQRSNWAQQGQHGTSTIDSFLIQCLVVVPLLGPGALQLTAISGRWVVELSQWNQLFEKVASKGLRQREERAERWREWRYRGRASQQERGKEEKPEGKGKTQSEEGGTGNPERERERDEESQKELGWMGKTIQKWDWRRRESQEGKKEGSGKVAWHQGEPAWAGREGSKPAQWEGIRHGMHILSFLGPPGAGKTRLGRISNLGWIPVCLSRSGDSECLQKEDPYSYPSEATMEQGERLDWWEGSHISVSFSSFIVFRSLSVAHPSINSLAPATSLSGSSPPPPASSYLTKCWPSW